MTQRNGLKMDQQSSQTMAALPPRHREIDALRQQIGRVEGIGRSGRSGVLPFGLPMVDSALPEGGLALASVHEVQGIYADGAGAAFCAALLGQLAREAGTSSAPILWLEAGEGLYLPGLARYGLQPRQVFVVSNIRKTADRLWVLEEALRCGALAGVVAELEEADFTASRRLQLAAEAGNTTALVLHEGGQYSGAGLATAVTRWQVQTMPSMHCPLNNGLQGVGAPCWDVALTQSRGGRPERWTLEWQEEQQTWHNMADVGAETIPLPQAANDMPANDDHVSAPVVRKQRR
jgi:protein ImuA